MYTRMTYRVFMVFMMVAMLNVTIGCDLGNVKSEENAGPSGVDIAKQSPVSTLGFSGNLLELSLPVTRVTIHDFDFDQGAGYLAVSYSYTGANGSPTFRQVSIESQNGSTEKCSAVVTGATRDLLVGLSLEQTDSNSYKLVEWTQMDTLSISRTLVGDRMHESYEFNGAAFSVSFTEEEIAQYLIEYARPQSQIALQEVAPPDSASLSYKAHEFIQFYPADNSLNDNFDGIVLVHMLESLEFRLWLEEATGVPGLVNQDKITAEQVCAVAGMATYKCLLGGWANFICVVAVGVDVACIIAEIHSWFA